MGEGKSQMIGPLALSAKLPFSVRGIWKRIFSLGTEFGVERHADLRPTPGKVNKINKRLEIIGKSNLNLIIFVYSRSDQINNG